MQGPVASAASHANCADKLRARSRNQKRFLHAACSPNAQRGVSFRPTVIPLETLRAAPKVLLHDHLDGGLRPASVIELARDQRYEGLPTTNRSEERRVGHRSGGAWPAF